MIPGPAALRAQDRAADGDTADLRWPPSAADLDAISWVDVRSAGEVDLRAGLWQVHRAGSSVGIGAVDRLPPFIDALTPPGRRRPAVLAVAVGASAILALATSVMFRPGAIGEANLTNQSPRVGAGPDAGAAPAAEAVPPIATSGQPTPPMVIPTPASASPDRVTPAESSLAVDETGGQVPRLAAAATTRGTSAVPGIPAPAAPATTEQPAAPAPIDVPPSPVPASLASTSIASPSLAENAPALASAIPARDGVDALAAPHPDAATSTASATAASAGVAAADVASVREALSRYGSAYSRLDAAAARAVWPSVDARALGRAFAELRSQHVTFDDCDIAVDGRRANAACRGATTYVPRAGDQSPRTEARAWRFELEKGSDANWRIAAANISVPRGSTRAR